MTREEAYDLAYDAYYAQAGFIPKIIDLLLEVDEESEGWKDKVIAIMTGCPNWAFWEIDNYPGKYGYEQNGKYWHHKLRQVRNDPALKPGLFDVLLPVSENKRAPA
jgi:hypothetical protein